MPKFTRSETNERSSEAKPFKPHPDYELNLAMAKWWINHRKKSFNDFFKARLSKDERELEISLQVPNKYAKPSYANRIFLHQSNAEFKNQTTESFHIFKQTFDQWQRKDGIPAYLDGLGRSKIKDETWGSFEV